MKIGNLAWKFKLFFQKSVLIISSIVIVVGLFVSILMRYVLKLDFYGVEEILLIPTIWLYFIGASYGSYEESHIAADFSDSFIKSQRVRSWLKVFTSLLTLIATVIFSMWTFDYFIWSIYNAGVTTGWEIPLFIYYLPIFISFVLMTIYSLYHLYRYLVKLIREGK